MNAKDKQLEVTRSMKVTCLPKKKSKFQTLDSFLSIIEDDGITKDVSSRCADLDSVMNEQLGTFFICCLNSTSIKSEVFLFKKKSK